MTTGMRQCKTTNMAVLKEQRSFEVASTLEKLDLGLSLRIEQKKSHQKHLDVFAVLLTG